MSVAELQYAFLHQLASLPFVEAIYLYGSRARGEHNSRSDIDLAVVCPQATERDWYSILKIIEEADTLLQIDCVRFDTLSDDPLKSSIERDKQIIYTRKEASRENK